MSKSKSKGTDAKYNITVQTGDKKGAGTHAHVNIILYGTDGIQTKECKLSNFLKGDFKRGKFESFSIKSEVHISEVRKIELWRDNNGSCTNWYLDWIEVTKCNKENSITTVFPALKWIKENYHYFFVNETTLPQNDPMKVSRRREMQVLQKEYQLDVKIPGLPAQVKVLPEDETFSWHYFLDVLLSKLAEYGIESHKLTKKGKGKEWKNVDDVKTVYTKAFGVPQVFDQSVLTGAYHVRDDGLLLYDAIKSYVEKYVLLYYSSESSLDADYELQNWGAELVKSRDDGGVGILGVPGNGNFKTTEQLVITLTAIIYTCSAGHATANFEQYDEYGAPFNYPFHLSGNPPTDKSPVAIERILNAIAKREMLLETMSITKVLSDKATDSLGHFEKQFIVDPHAVQIVEEFRQKLQEVGKTIDERNQKREYPYEWLRPQAVPNAISI